jgi:hypothetical protein
MPEYGYMHLGRVISIEAQGYSCEIITRAPGLRWGPVQSMVAGLVVGERVVLAQLGESVDSLVIVGRLPGRTGQIGDIDGLQAALDAKLDDSQLDQASGVAALDSGRKMAYARLPVGTVASTVAAGDDARLSDARTPLAHHTTHATAGSDPIAPADIGAATAAALATTNTQVSTNQANIAGIAAYQEFDGQKMFRLYGDAVTTMSRYAGTTASAALTSGNAYAFTLSSARSITMLNAHVSVLSGAGATLVASVYGSPTAGGSMPLIATGPTMTVVSGNDPLQCGPGPGAFSVAAGFIVVLLEIVSGSITLGGSAALDASMLSGFSGMRVAASKALTGTPPSTINTGDGTWSYWTSMPYIALD